MSASTEVETVCDGEEGPGGKESLLIPSLIAAGGLILAMVVTSLWVFVQIGPDALVPIHWNAKGEVDGFGGRGYLFVMPGLALLELAILVAAPYFEPRVGRKLLHTKAYPLILLGAIVTMACVHAVVLSAAQGRDYSLRLVIGTATGGFLMLIGNYLGKVRSNFILGIRTPWTLSSELAWKKTHRLGGRLFVLLGLGIVLSAWNQTFHPHLIWVEFGGVAVLVAVTTVYSYWVWKNDPKHRVSPGS